MRILLIGGTGTISMAITRRLLAQGHRVYLVNRGSRLRELEEELTSGSAEEAPGKTGAGAAAAQCNRPVWITADVNDEEALDRRLAEVIEEEQEDGHMPAGGSRPFFDTAADFIAYGPEPLQRDYRCFAGRIRQFIYVSTASAYQTPPADYRINEGTPLQNPYWEYSRRKIAGENYLMERYREDGFPVTIVRPSHTFDERKVPVGLHGDHGSWQTLQRMLDGKPVIIPGDGNSLWTVTASEDFAVGFTGLIGNPHAIGQAVQIMSPESMTWNQIHEVIADELGVPLRAVHISTDFLVEAARGRYDLEGSLLGDKSQNVVFDVSKLQRLVPEFRPRSMAERLRETVRYVAAHPEYQTKDPAFDDWCDRVIAARETALQALR